MQELFNDFMNGVIDNTLFRKIASEKFKRSEELIAGAINKKENNNENKTRTHYQDKQGEKVSDETSSPT
jgi:hypothetical protein